jgi:hypothetical protein
MAFLQRVRAVSSVPQQLCTHGEFVMDKPKRKELLLPVLFSTTLLRNLGAIPAREFPRK